MSDNNEGFKVNLKELVKDKTELLAPGHRMCAGCGPAIVARQVLKGTRGPTMVCNATGCLEVATTIYPYTAWNLPWAHAAFECAGALAGGIEGALKAMAKRTGSDKKIDVIAFGGDGGTFDIGLQSLSGALERGHDFVYVCYDNEAYMNTGIQRSSATPHCAATTTSPAGKVIPGKPQFKKDFARICVAHGIDYVATSAPHLWKDVITKARKAIEVDGPAVLHIIAPCPRGWRFEPSETLEISKLAVKTRVFPIYEVDHGVWKLNVAVKNPLPVEDYLKVQGRFKHLFKDGFEHNIKQIQERVDRHYEDIVRMCECTGGTG